MTAELKVGIVGANRARGFMRGFGAVAETHVVAACDIDEANLDRICTEQGIEQRYADYEDMVTQDLDIILVSTPMPLHAPQSIRALDEGKHVLSEVPAATDLQQCRDLVASARRSGKKYMMAENYCYRRPTVLVKALAEAGLFGEMYYAEGGYIHELKELNEKTPWRRKWQTGVDGCTYGTHSLGPITQWMKERVVQVSCAGSGHHYVDPRNDPYEMQDSVLMLCRMALGGLVQVRCDMLSNRPHNMTHYELQGTRGCYRSAGGAGDEDRVWLRDRPTEGGKVEWRPLMDMADEFLLDFWKNPPEEALQAGHGGGDYWQVRDFVDSILNDTKPAVDIYDAMDYTVPGLISQQSIARDGAWLDVPDMRDVAVQPAR